MRKKGIAVLIVLLLVLGSAAGTAVFAAAPSGIGTVPTGSESEGGERTEKPTVTISGWKRNPDTSSSAVYIRDVLNQIFSAALV